MGSGGGGGGGGGFLVDLLCLPLRLLLEYFTLLPLLALAPFSLLYDFLAYLRLKLAFSRVGAKSRSESEARHADRVREVQRQVSEGGSR